jgi:hypothetical protein
MALTPVAGSTRLRSFQIGKETTFKTQVPATRRMPWAFTPSVNPGWTFPTADTGTLDQAIAPYRTALQSLGQSVGQLAYNDIPTILGFGIKGGLSGTTWTAVPASTSQDTFDTGTLEFFDDATADAWAATGGVIDRIELAYPGDMGPIVATCDWREAAVVYPATPTGALQVDAAPTYAFMGDTIFYANDTSGAIETTALTDICYDASVIIENNIDVKYWANGSNTRFQAQNYGRGERVVTFALNGAKQTAWIAECAKWIGANPTERFFGIKTTSPVAGYSLDIRIPGYWMTRDWTEINTNTGFRLTAHQIYDQTLSYPISIVAVTTRATL